MLLGPDGRYLLPYQDPGKFTFSRVRTNVHALAFENIGPLVVISLVVSSMPRLGLFFVSLLALGALLDSGLPPQVWMPLFLIGGLTLNHLIPSFLLIGAIGEQVSDAMAGKRIRILPALGRAVFHMPSMILSALGIGLVLVLSLPMLLVPAFAIVPLMLPAPAACAMRKQGLRLAFAETASIARGNRWPIILAGGVWMVGVSSLGQISGMLATSAKTVGASSAWLMAPALVLYALESIIGACVGIAIYLEARRVADHKSVIETFATA